MSELALKSVSVGELTTCVPSCGTGIEVMVPLATVPFRKAVHGVMRSEKLALPLTSCSTWKSKPFILPEQHSRVDLGGRWGQLHEGDQFTCSQDPGASSSDFHRL